MRLSLKVLDALQVNAPRWLQKIWDYLYPPRCGVCSAFCDKPLCLQCRSGWDRVRPPYCLWCGQPFPPVPMTSPLCGHCLRGTFRFDGARPAVLYQGLGRETVHALKFKRKARLAVPMGQLMAQIVMRMLDGDDGRLPEPWSPPDLILPVPLHFKVLRLRGFNQAERLAREVAQIVPATLMADLILQVRPAKPQATLTAKERWENVKGIFALHQPERVKGKVVLVVDDVMTTGATVNEIARLLKNGGARSVYVVTFARGQL